MDDRSRAYYIREGGHSPELYDRAGYPSHPNGYAGPYGNDIPMETYSSNYDEGPQHSRQPRPRSEGFCDPDQGPSGHSWARQDQITDTAELLERLPSRQLEALTLNRTLRHRRHKSFHGTVRIQPGSEELEELSRTLANDETDYDADEVDERIRGMTTTLSSKREIKRKFSSRKKRRPGRCTQLKYSIGMGWQHFKYQIAEVMYSLELWKSHLKKIEGHFGTGVKSYFLFLKWLFLMNIPIFLLTFGFVVIPQLLHRLFEEEDGKPIPVVFERAYPGNGTKSFTGVELLTGVGWFESTELYYGYYTGSTIELFTGIRYKMIYAYLFTCFGYYLLCLLILAHSILRSYRKYYIEGSSEFSFFFVSKVFCGWDYGITSMEAASLKQKSAYNELREYLSGLKGKRKKTIAESCQVFWTRICTNLIVMGLLGGSGYLVYFISSTQSIKNTIPVLSLLALPLVITAINMILPAIFSLIEHLEKYEKPKNELYMHMIRTMTLRATNLSVLVYFWFAKAPQETECWESFMGEEIYRLVIVDFIFTLLYTFFFEFVRKLISKYCVKKLERAEFEIGGNTLDLIYSQALCWLGTFYSPLLSLIVIVKLWIIFYVKRISVIQNCKPSMRPWRAARSHTIFLGFLFIFFLLTTAAVACGILFIEPSHGCGPYQSQNTTYQVVLELVDSWKEDYNWLREAVQFISSPGFIAGMVVLLSMGTYYMRIAMIGHKEMVNLLQQQLALEGKDKNFLLNLLQQVSRRNNKNGENPRRGGRIAQDDTSSQFTSPGGRAFARQMVETSARM